MQTAYCKSTVGYVDLNVRNTGVLTDLFINGFKGTVVFSSRYSLLVTLFIIVNVPNFRFFPAFIIGQYKPMVEARMCSMIEKMLNHDMNLLLATMPLKVRHTFSLLRNTPT